MQHRLASQELGRGQQPLPVMAILLVMQGRSAEVLPGRGFWEPWQLQPFACRFVSLLELEV
jgi:hypothetical protein